MAMRKRSIDIEYSSGNGSRLPDDVSEKLLAAGISIEDQNKWFWRRLTESKATIGVDFVEQNGVTILFCTGDWLAEEINKRFNDQLCNAFGYNWKTVGEKGRRLKEFPDNPQFGPASREAPKPHAEQIENLRCSLRDFNIWINEHRDQIKSWELITAIKGVVTRVLDHEIEKQA